MARTYGNLPSLDVSTFGTVAALSSEGPAYAPLGGVSFDPVSDAPRSTWAGLSLDPRPAGPDAAEAALRVAFPGAVDDVPALAVSLPLLADAAPSASATDTGVAECGCAICGGSLAKFAPPVSGGDGGGDRILPSAIAATPLDAIQGSVAFTRNKLGTTKEIYVYFANDGVGRDTVSTGIIGESDWTDAEKADMMQAFTEIERLIDINFIETTDSDAEFWIHKNSTLGAFGAAYTPNQGNPYQGNMYMNHSKSRFTSGLDKGGQGYETAVHEIGHLLGLGHPHDDSAGTDTLAGITGSGDNGDFELGTPTFTIMSYDDGWEDAPWGGTSSVGFGNQSNFAPLDIKALQNLYGANTTYASGNNTYSIPTTNGAGTYWTAIWDTGGNDTITFASHTADVTLDLNDATLAYEVGGGGWRSYAYGIDGGFTIANGVVIENGTGGSGNDSITGNQVANTLDGNAGNDTIFGGDGDDTLIGDAGNDSLVGGYNADSLTGGDGADTLRAGVTTGSQSGVGDTLRGGADNDVITGAYGADSLVGDDGDDIIYAAVTETGALNTTISDGGNTLVGGDGNDILRGAGGNDSLDAGSGNDILNGYGGNDTIDGDDGSELLDGGDGNDFIDFDTGNDTVNGGAGDDYIGNTSASLGTWGDFSASDRIDGGAGTDTLSASFAFATGPLVVDIDGTSIITLNGVAAGLFTGIEVLWISGTSAADSMDGGAFNDTLLGNGGNDTLWGRGGGDLLDGGAGDDSLWGSAGGTDTMIGGAGNDTLNGGSSNDSIDAGADNDVMDMDGGTDTVNAGDGNDYVGSTVLGLLGANWVSLGDSIDGGLGTDTLAGYFYSVAGPVNLSGASSLSVNGVSPTITGFEAFVIGGSNTANDTLLGGGLADSLLGYGGNDFIDGGFGADTLRGGAGNDTLDGAFDGANDLLDGGDGDDFIDVDSGTDTVLAGAGNDYVGGTLFGEDDWNATAGDSLDGGPGTDTLAGDAAGQAVLDGAANTLTIGGAAVILAGFEVFDFFGSTLADTLIGGSLADTLNGGAGDDSIDGGTGGNDSLRGGDGNDTIYDAGGADTIFGDGGDDFIEGGLSGGQMYGGSGDDTMFAAFDDGVNFSGVANTMDGGAGNDQMNGSGGDDTITGGDGDDLLVGNNGNDSVDGGAGSDVIVAATGLGDDTYDGGADSDVLNFSSAVNAVTLNTTTGVATGADIGSDTFSGFESYVGGAGDDSITGSTAAESFEGGDGNDSIVGLGGLDTVSGGAGDDTVFWQPIGGGGTGASGSQYDGGAGVDLIHGGNTTFVVGVIFDLGVGTYTTGGGFTQTWTGFENFFNDGTGSETVRGGGAANTITTGSGNNSIFGEGSADTIVAGGGNDTIEGGFVTDSIDAGAGDDLIRVLLGEFYDSVDGGSGNDTLDHSASDYAGTTFDFLGGAITGTGLNGPSATLAGIEVYRDGSGGNTIISDGSGLYEGNGGDDTMDAGLGVLETLDGGAGVDLLTTSQFTGDYLVNLETGATNYSPESLVNFENAQLGIGNDTVIGTSGANEIDGGAGNDSLEGGTGGDTLRGGDGDDFIAGLDASNTDIDNALFGDAGNDTIIVGDIASSFGADGGADNDAFLTRVNRQIGNIEGGSGDDTLDASVMSSSSDALTIDLGAGTLVQGGTFSFDLFNVENVVGTQFQDSITGSAGANELDGQDGNDNLDGGDGDDTLLGAAGADVLGGGDGADLLGAGDGNDTLQGGAGADQLFGAAGVDEASYTDVSGGVDVSLLTNSASDGDTLNGIENLRGGAGDDSLTGAAGVNALFGEDGADILAGEAGGDLLGGGNGNDTLQGGAGADQLFGAAGIDEASYSDFVAAVTVSLVTNVASDGDTLNGVENLRGGAGDDSLTGNGVGNVLTGGAGGDSLIGNGGNDTLAGEDGDDLLGGGAGNDVLIGGIGADRFFGAAGADEASFADFLTGITASLVTNTSSDGDTFNSIENLRGGAGDDSLAGSAGANRLTGGDGGDTLLGNAGNDTLFGEVGADLLGGGDGNDAISGDDGSDSLYGAGGNDSLTGGADNDTLSGSAGLDVFRFVTDIGTAGVDRITDFLAVDDLIALDDAVFTGLSAGALAASAFVLGAAAGDADDRILYDNATGALFYDEDGIGSAAAVQFAVLSGAPTITAADFFVI